MIDTFAMPAGIQYRLRINTFPKEDLVLRFPYVFQATFKLLLDPDSLCFRAGKARTCDRLVVGFLMQRGVSELSVVLWT